MGGREQKYFLCLFSEVKGVKPCFLIQTLFSGAVLHITLFKTEIIESSKRSAMLKSRVWASCFSDSEWDSVCAGVDDSKVLYRVDCFEDLDGRKVESLWKSVQFLQLFGVSSAFAAVFGHALHGTCAHLCVWSFLQQPPHTPGFDCLWRPRMDML